MRLGPHLTILHRSTLFVEGHRVGELLLEPDMVSLALTLGASVHLSPAAETPLDATTPKE